MEKGHCNDEGKLDGSMKAHYRSFFMCFDATKYGKCVNNYFYIEKCESFTLKSTYDDC